MDEPTPLVVRETGFDTEEGKLLHEPVWERRFRLPLAAEKKLKFYEIEWFIDDFYIQSSQQNWKACSPELDGPQKTKLQLFIKRASNEDIADIFSFTVKRLDSDLGPETLWVNVRVDVSGPKYILKDKLVLLNKGTEIETNFAAMDGFFYGRERESFLKPHTFYIGCEMVIYTEDEIEGLEFWNASLKSLSDDMLALYESGLLSDMELKIRDYSLPVHRAILCNHVPEIRILIQKEAKAVGAEITDVVACDLSTVVQSFDCEAMRRVMAFIYTGNIKHVLEQPSISIYDWASQLGIGDILACYAVKSLICETPSNVEVYECMWPVDFRTVFENKEISHSEILHSANSSRTWQFHMYLKGNGDSDFVAVVAETNEEIKFMNMCFEVSVTKEDERLPVIHILRNNIDGCKRFEFDEFSYKNWMLSYETEGINLAIKIRLCRIERGSSETKHEDISRPFFRHFGMEPYMLMYFNMMALLQDKVLCDGIIQSGDLSICVHKFILASRCSVLYNRLCSALHYGLTEDLDKFKRISNGTASNDGSETEDVSKRICGACDRMPLPIVNDVSSYSFKNSFKFLEHACSSRDAVLCDRSERGGGRVVLNKPLILGIKQDVFNIIMRFIYTGGTYFDDEVVEVYKAARELKLPQLEEACVKTLLLRIKKDEMLLYECVIAAADTNNKFLYKECVKCLQSLAYEIV